MKKIFTFLMVSVLAFVLIGCKDPVVEYTFELDADIVTTIQVGSSTTIYADTDKASPVFEYSSSDTAIATVDAAGSVKGVSVGVATITVKLEGVGEKTIEITVTQKDYTTAQLKTALTAVLTKYLDAKNGSIKVTVNDGIDTMVSETAFNYATDGSLDSLKYKVVIDEEIHVYVKDGFSYMLANGAKTKKELTAQEETTIKTSYGHSVFLDSVTKFYNEDKFYSALEFKSQTTTTVEFLLDVSKYTGTVFNTEGADEIKVIATLTDGAVSKVEVNTKVGTTTKTMVVEYLGTSPQTIVYPADLESYVG